MLFTKRPVCVYFALPLLVGLFLTLANTKANSSRVTSAERFVESLANSAITTLTGDDVSDNERQENFRILLNKYFDIKKIGRWALGRYWRKANREQKDQYLKLFEKMIVRTYSNRFKTYSGEKLAVTGSKSRKGSIMVNSRFQAESQKPIRIDWRVFGSNGNYKIFDISVEGVSLVQTQRSQFSSVIRRNGGKISGLLSILKEKEE